MLDEPTVGMDVKGRHEFWTAMRAFAARGNTVLFATHYMEEADAYADRVLLMADGTIIADGPPTQIKAIVGSWTIRATLPIVDLAPPDDLPGVTTADRHGEAVVLTCSNSDEAIRALLADYPDARDVEITGAGLEEAFMRLTVGDVAGDELAPREGTRS